MHACRADHPQVQWSMLLDSTHRIEAERGQLRVLVARLLRAAALQNDGTGQVVLFTRATEERLFQEQEPERTARKTG